MLNCFSNFSLLCQVKLDPRHCVHILPGNIVLVAGLQLGEGGKVPLLQGERVKEPDPVDVCLDVHGIKQHG